MQHIRFLQTLILLNTSKELQESKMQKEFATYF